MSDEPQHMSTITAEFSTAIGYTAERRAVNWDEAASRYVAHARMESAQARFNAFAEESPVLVSTDWQRPAFAPNRAAIDTVRGWQYGKRGMLLSGETGLGKTRAVVDLFRRLASEGKEVHYYFAGDWFERMQAQKTFGNDHARGWVEACALRPIVILDDLGQQAMQKAQESWAQAWLFRFLDIRIAKGLPLILSTNLSSKQMVQFGGEVRGDPLMRRLLELCEVVKFI